MTDSSKNQKPPPWEACPDLSGGVGGGPKSELRRAFLSRQRSLTDAEAATMSQRICEQLFAGFDWRNWRSVHCFLPIVRNREIDTWLIMNRLAADFPHIVRLVPRTDAATLSMTQHPLTAETVLVETAWGVPEPQNGEPVAPETVDCVLVPLLAFDKRGYRVGYGKGFYDRFLVQCRPDAPRIGLSYFPPVDEISDTNQHDIRLTHCVTPDTMIVF
ncbi:MAG: 5-formyltetrahydrofolate cyclo-ligase [Cytophagales bacterium]|nr:5-formyltetrahydrofolate cyclo-ligase [Cytophagales bacterium]